MQGMCECVRVPVECAWHCKMILWTQNLRDERPHTNKQAHAHLRAVRAQRLSHHQCYSGRAGGGGLIPFNWHVAYTQKAPSHKQIVLCKCIHVHTNVCSCACAWLCVFVDANTFYSVACTHVFLIYLLFLWNSWIPICFCHLAFFIYFYFLQHTDKICCCFKASQAKGCFDDRCYCVAAKFVHPYNHIYACTNRYLPKYILMRMYYLYT